MIYIILPAFNEKKNLIKIFKKINKLKLVKNIKVILVDDCSSDKTFEIKNTKMNFKLIYIRNNTNKGLSITLERGFKKAFKISKRGDHIVTLDSDNTHPIEIIPSMLRKLKKENSDIVIASRFLKKSRVNGLSLFRKSLSFFAKILFILIFPYKNLREYTCNFRIYKPILVAELLKNKNFFKNEDFNIAAKILIFLINNYNNLKISEYPFILNYHYKIGVSKMNVSKTIYLTFKLILNGIFKR